MSARHVTLKVGEEHAIRLPGLSTAGYRWSFEVEGDREAIEVTQGWGVRPGSREAVGTGAEEIFTVAARRQGRARLLFEQRRRWEGDAPPVGSLVVRVEVEP